jgi:two-component system OmpR family sensor kinase
VVGPRLGSLRTLRTRLVAAAAGAIVAAVAVFGVITVLLVGNELHGSLDQALRQRAEDVAQLAVSAPAVLSEPGALESPATDRQIAVEVLDAHGRILARSLTLGARLLPEDRLARQARHSGHTELEDLVIDGRPFRLFAAPIARAGGPASGGAVLVAAETGDISSTLGDLGLGVVLSGAAVALLATLAAGILTRGVLRPLRRLAVAAGEIERTADPSQRLPEAEAQDEIGQLTGVLNRMLASLEQARAGERRFLADASHELRTPVTALLGNVEYAARHGADQDVLQDLRSDAERLARLVDSLLALERLEVTGRERRRLALDELVRSVVREHPGADGRVALGRLDPAVVLADRDGLGRVLANLIDNGLLHGPPSGPVTVTLLTTGPTARLTVSDEGTGPDPDQRERLFERFWRAPTAAARPGSGLGLSIVEAIVEGHGGQITVEGAAFTVELPLASGDSSAGATAGE